MMTYMYPETRNVEPQIGSATAKHLTPAGACLVRHHHVPHNIANYIAERAGLRVEVRHG